MNELVLSKVFPNIELLDISKIPEDLTYIGTVGFEDRCFTFLERCCKTNIKFRKVIGIKYEPFDKRNHVERFKELAIKVTEKSKLEYIVYDRYGLGVES